MSLFSLGFLRLAYAANISEHLPTQPWEYTHKDQTTTPGTSYVPCSLRTVSGFFNVPQSYLLTRVVRRGLRAAKELDSVDEKSMHSVDFFISLGNSSNDDSGDGNENATKE